MGPVPFTLSAEMFPLEHRMVGMSMVVSLNLLLGGVFNLVVPLIPNEYILLGIFAGANILAWILAYRYVREPEIGKSASTALRLEEVFEIYQPVHSKHMDFQWRHKKDALLTVWDFIRWRETPANRRHYFIDWVRRQSNTDAGVHGVATEAHGPS